MSSPEQMPTQDNQANALESAPANTVAEQAALDARKAEEDRKSAEKAKAKRKELHGHGNDHGKEKKETGMIGKAAKGSAIVAGGFVGTVLAGIWGLFSLYKEAFFGKSSGGGSKKSGSGGGGGGGHGGGGHH